MRTVAEEAGWTAALHLESAIPFDALAWSIHDGVVHELHDGHQRRVVLNGRVAFNRSTGKVLGWFIEHKPDRVPALFGRIIGGARDLGVKPDITKKSLRHAVLHESGIEITPERLDEFLHLAFPPAK